MLIVTKSRVPKFHNDTKAENDRANSFGIEGRDRKDEKVMTEEPNLDNLYILPDHRIYLANHKVRQFLQGE